MSVIRVLHGSPPLDEPTLQPPWMDCSGESNMWDACLSQWGANRPS